MKKVVTILMVVMFSFLANSVLADVGDAGLLGENSDQAVHKRFKERTKEERQVRQERRENMTEQQRQAIREKRYNMSEEQRQARHERRANMSDEEVQVMQERRAKHKSSRGQGQRGGLGW